MISPAEFKEQVVELLTDRRSTPLSATEIATALKLKGNVRKRIRKWLSRMVFDGDIVSIRDNRYSLGAQADLMAGSLDVSRAGDGFVDTADGRADVFVPKKDLGMALPGDRVVVRLHSEPPRDGSERRTGKVIRILDRARRDIVGTLRSTGRFLYVVPLDPVYTKDFYVPDSAGAPIGSRVVIRFTAWENKHVSPEAEIIETLGPADSPSVDTVSVIRHHSLREKFSAQVMREAESVSALTDAPGDRLDLRDKLVITIDPQRARDFDDALSLEQDSKGNRLVGVHIADVGHFVSRGTVLDKEAASRGTSVYLPDKVIPMLPEQLSNGICSLKPDHDRLAFSVFITIDGTGKVVSRRFAKTTIRSKLRLTYEQAMDAIDGESARSGCRREKKGSGAVSKADRPKRTGGTEFPGNLAARSLLQELSALAQQLRKRRFARHALDLDVRECEIELGRDGMMTGIRLVENDRSHQLIEEFMIAANEAVAAELSANGFPVIFRAHAPPSEQKIRDLTDELSSMGYHPPDLTRRRNLAAFLKTAKNDPLAHHIRVAVLRSMSHAVYSQDSIGHFGLAKKLYAHFTSPIRRYPDLVLHRQLATLVTGTRRHSYKKEEISDIAHSCSETERTAEQAERTLIEIKKYRFLAAQLSRGRPQVYDAVVVSVVNFGMFVEVLDLQVQGLVHVSAISDRFVRFNRRRRALCAGNRNYKVGTKLKVHVAGVDLDKRRIDFALDAHMPIGHTQRRNQSGRRSSLQKDTGNGNRKNS